jgi:SHS family lactate transporter-like MFS transporter
VWDREKAANWSELRRSILRHWPIFLYLVALMTMMNLSSHGTQDLYPTFLQRDRGLGVDKRSELTAISMVGAIIGGIVFGFLSDRVGRRKAMVWAFAGAILMIPFWALPEKLWMLMAGAFALQFMVQGAWGIIPAHISELSPPGIRGFMPGFAYQVGNLIAAYIAILETRSARHFGYGKTLSVSAVIIFVIAAIVTSLGRERRAVEFASGVVTAV